MQKIVPLIVLLSLLTVATYREAAADYYKYTDSEGAISITNNLKSVPAKYRSAVTVVRDDDLAKKDPGARKQVQQPQSPQQPQSQSQPEPEPAAAAKADAEEPAPAPGGKFAELSARFVWFKPLVYIAAFFAGLVAVIKLTSVVPSPILSKLIYVCFFLGVFVFMYKAYVQHVVETSLKVKEQAAAMMKKSTVREAAPEGDAAILKEK